MIFIILLFAAAYLADLIFVAALMKAASRKTEDGGPRTAGEDSRRPRSGARLTQLNPALFL